MDGLISNFVYGMIQIGFTFRLATSPSLYIKEYMKKFIDCMYSSDSKSTNYYGREEISSGVIREGKYIDFLCHMYTTKRDLLQV